MIKNFNDFLNEDKNNSEDLTKPFAMVMSGGSIGEKRPSDILDKKGRKLIKTFDTEELAKETTIRWNKMLSPGEKSHYGIKYSVVPTSNFDDVNENVNSINQTFNVYWTLKADESEAQGEEDIENIIKLSELLVDLIADEKVDNDSIRIETEG